MADRRLLTGALVMTGPAWVPAPADVLVDGAIIEAIGRPGELSHADAAVVDLSGRLVMPGLVNAHVHSHNMVARGANRDWTLEASLLHGAWMSAERRRELAGLAALLAGAETMSSGAVGAFDLLAQSGIPDPDVLVAAAEAYHRTGLRVRLAPMVADRSVHEAVPVIGACCAAVGSTLPAATPTADLLTACEHFVAGMPPDADVTAAVAPTIPSHCTTELMLGLRQLADRHGLPVHLHLAESKPQAISASERFGRSITAELAAIGMLDGPLTAAHGIWVDDADIELLADAGSTVVTVPGSNLRLGSGVAPTASLLDAGVQLAVGTDGANSADALDVLDATRLATLLSRISSAGPDRWLSVEHALDAATVGGAAACGWSDTGRLEAGRRADLCVVDLRGPAFHPATDVANQLLTAARAADVTDVMVAGTFHYRDRRHVGIDLDSARSRWDELAEELLAGVQPRRDLAETQVAASRDALEELRARPWPVERLLP